jgi:hypothetical protein
MPTTMRWSWCSNYLLSPPLSLSYSILAFGPNLLSILIWNFFLNIYSVCVWAHEKKLKRFRITTWKSVSLRLQAIEWVNQFFESLMNVRVDLMLKSLRACSKRAMVEGSKSLLKKNVEHFNTIYGVIFNSSRVMCWLQHFMQKIVETIHPLLKGKI